MPRTGFMLLSSSCTMSRGDMGLGTLLLHLLLRRLVGHELISGGRSTTT